MSTPQKECPDCDGAGSITANDSRNNDPQQDYDVPCWTCNKTGWVDDDEAEGDDDES